MVGDGFCNDEANNAENDYDGGDCCGPCVLTEHCTECECFHQSGTYSKMIKIKARIKTYFP